MTDTSTEPVWKKTTCILCESNCGVEVRIEDGHFTRIRGNKAHVGSTGYTCEKALRLGSGVDHPDETGEHGRVGVAPNELTELGWEDEVAGTPWHKHVPAQLEQVS